jgi:hypothetical protein
LVVSARSAQLLDATTAKPLAGADLHPIVDLTSRSFIVVIPASVLPVGGTWTVRLAAGLADPSGTAFLTVPPRDGAVPTGANVYDTAFRTFQQEAELVCPTSAVPNATLASTLQSVLGGGTLGPVNIPVAECGNFWMDNDQANTLAAANVSKYALAVDWSQLEERATTPDPEPAGYSNRWYPTPLDLGQGVVTPSVPEYTPPTYVGRIQSYAVYVPTTYRPGNPAPLTWMLHSLEGNLNQYGALAPSQIQQECQDRGSICASPEGFSEGGWYYGPAEVDFWDVWHQLAVYYDLYPDATVISGYSMGGFASYKLTLEYPDLFAQAMPLEGPPVCGLQVIPGIVGYASGGQCTHDSDTTAQVVNAKWIPYVMTYGGIDELVPASSGLEQISQFQKLGYRYYAVLYPAEDHLVFVTQNDLAPATSQLDHLERPIDPGQFTFTWYPDLVSSLLGIGPTQDYWVSGLRARVSTPGTLATINASSAAIPDPAVTVADHAGVANGPTPALTESETWTFGARPAPEQILNLSLTDVAAASVNMARAGLRCPAVHIVSDGPTGLTFDYLAPGTGVFEGATRAATATASGEVTVSVGAGRTNLQVCATPASITATGSTTGNSTDAGSKGSRQGSRELPLTGGRIDMGVALLG